MHDAYSNGEDNLGKKCSTPSGEATQSIARYFRN